MSGIINKIKEAVHSDKHSDPEGTHGPHNNRAANFADPTVDSDRDGSRNMGATGGIRGENYNTSGGAPEGTYGHHNNRVANALDPRIDSDADGSRRVGGNTGTTGTTGTYGGENFTSATSGGAREGAFGHHNNRAANALDPRIDSDADGSRTLGSSNTYGTTGNTYGTTGANYSGSGPAPNTQGPHRSDALNKLDPRVEARPEGNTFGGSNTYGTTGGLGQEAYGTTGTTGNNFSGTGPAPNTQGPHRSDMLNKLDPRVEARPEGNTFGGSNTYNSEGGFDTGRDPTDASQVPPSVLKKHLGEPSIEHDDELHNRDGRHRRMSHQEQFRGI